VQQQQQAHCNAAHHLTNTSTSHEHHLQQQELEQQQQEQEQELVGLILTCGWQWLAVPPVKRAALDRCQAAAGRVVSSRGQAEGRTRYSAVAAVRVRLCCGVLGPIC